jgi:DNA-binding transcriptional ArsR family regulator
MRARADYTAQDVNVVPAASLLAEPARAAMLTAMLDDRPLAAGELARLAGVSPATASAHLARLLHGGLVTVVKQGRHRYYRLAGPEIAAVMEALAHLSPVTPVRSLRQSQDAAALALARTCYDHLAGRAGVALLDALLARRLLVAPQANDLPERFEVTADGLATFGPFGLDMGALKRTRRRFAGACLDWTERKPHLNGALGAAITARLLGLGWLERGTRRRAVRITPAGEEGLAATFGWSLEA